MTADELFTVIGDVDPRYLIESEKHHRGMAAPRIAAAAAACLVLGAVLPLSLLRRPALPDVTTPALTTTAPSPVTAPPDTTAPPLGWEELTPAVGGTDLRSMHFLEDAGNLAYLYQFPGEPALLAEGELETWVDEVYLALPPDEQNRLPALYRAIHELGVSRDAFVAVNDLRRAAGKSMVLDAAFIDALFADTEEEAIQALLHPFALYVNGRAYSWNEARALRQSGALTLSPEEEAAYLRRVEAFCRELGLLNP